MGRTGRATLDQVLEDARFEMELSQQALRAGDREAAWNRMFSALSRLSASPPSTASDALLVSASLELSNLGFIMGKGFTDLTMLLQDAFEAARRPGDKRSQALIKLHLGRLYYLGERRQDATALFSEGKEEVEELGDEDILTRSAEFIGLHYFTRGLFIEALGYFERALQSFETFRSKTLVNPSAPIWLGYCAAYMGEYHRAIGILDYYRRFSMEKGDKSLATTIRTVLGIVLLLAQKKQEAFYHLSGALPEAIRTKNALALYFSRGGLAYHHFLEGRLTEAREFWGQTLTEGATAGLIRQYASPLVLEMLYAFDKWGLPPLPQMNFQTEVRRSLQEPNIHLRGVALRLRAAYRSSRGEDRAEILTDLEASEEYLTRAGTPVQLAKTRIEMVRLLLGKGDYEAARQLAQKARMALSGYGEGFFPDDLRHLLKVGNETLPGADSSDELLPRFMNIVQELIPTADLDRLLSRTVEVTNRYFGAERGGVFWFGRGKGSRDPVLKAAYNLTLGDVASEDFQPNLGLIRKAYQENTPRVEGLGRSSDWAYREKAILCLPFEIEGRVRGVVYHDNSYLDGCFDLLTREQLAQMARYLSTYLGRIHEHCMRIEQRVAERAQQIEADYSHELLWQSSAMEEILSQADQVAASESTVLVLGETGVGKELLARRIHRMSPRRDNALIIVDLSAIPENLVESELFGHEKGAFTGADRKKMGRLELAHGGTLFIDEVGEIPNSIQVKLLRVLQEKTLVRIGDTRSVRSDFRLIAATNRDLSEEIAVGRFRKDLYYRLNVVPITVPPLRERTDDVVLLARHYVNRYSVRYNRPEVTLAPGDEARLQEYDWPGNVRELQNVIERAVLLAEGKMLALDLPSSKQPSVGDPFADLPTLDEIQRRYIRYVLANTNGRISGEKGAAKVLGVKRSSLYSRMAKLGLR